MMRSRLPPAILGALALLGMSATVVWAQGVPAPVSNATVTVNGTSSVTSDGGFGVVVNGSVAVTQPLTVTSDGGLGVRVNGSVTVAQPVVVDSDGGMGVVIRGPLQTISDGGVAVGVFAPDVVRVVGPTFGNVIVSGTVDLSTTTLGTLGAQTCELGETRRVTVTTTPSLVPSVGMTNRTAITLINTSNSREVSCRPDPGDGGVPDCASPGFGVTLFNQGGSVKFPVRETKPVRCVACAGTAPVEYQEESCVAP